MDNSFWAMNSENRYGNTSVSEELMKLIDSIEQSKARIKTRWDNIETALDSITRVDSPYNLDEMGWKAVYMGRFPKSVSNSDTTKNSSKKELSMTFDELTGW